MKPRARCSAREPRRSVTGLVVNDRPGVCRAEIRRLRAILHRARSEGLASQDRAGRPDSVAWLRGKVAFRRDGAARGWLEAPGRAGRPAEPDLRAGVRHANPPICPAGSEYRRLRCARAADGPFPKGLPQTPEFFPLAVWLQAPANAARYRAIGINIYVGLWRGPTEAQLDALDQAGIRLICGQNQRSLAIQGPRRRSSAGCTATSPTTPSRSGGARAMGRLCRRRRSSRTTARSAGPTPIARCMLNLGQGVAWDGWYGRGVRTNHPEDYAEYVKGCDIASFDIYPASHENEGGRRQALVRAPGRRSPPALDRGA